jgi:hypothetical protein
LIVLLFITRTGYTDLSSKYTLGKSVVFLFDDFRTSATVKVRTIINLK